MYQGLLHLHNIGRWVVLLLLLVAIINAISGIAATRPYGKTQKILLVVFYCAGYYLPFCAMAIQRGGATFISRSNLISFKTGQIFWLIFLGQTFVKICSCRCVAHY